MLGVTESANKSIGFGSGIGKVSSCIKKSLWNGKSSKFSEGFNGYMYACNTLDAATKERERRDRAIKRLKEQEELKKQRHEMMNSKIDIVNHYYTQYGSKLHPFTVQSHVLTKRSNTTQRSN